MTQALSILIVDDEQSIRHGLKYLIDWEKYGFYIMGEAENGYRALDIIKQTPPDIVITDLMMPEMDGITLSTIIHQQYPTIKFIVLSSYDDFHLVSQSFKNGAVDYILKPTLSHKTLLPILEKIGKGIKKSQYEISDEERLSQLLNRYLVGYQLDFPKDIKHYFKNPSFQILYTNERWHHQSIQMTQKLGNILNKEPYIECLPFHANDTGTGLLIAHSLSEEQLLDYLIHALTSISYLEKKSFFILSALFHELSDMKELFNQLAQEANNQRFYFKQHVIVPVNELLPLTLADHFDANKFIRTLLEQDFESGLNKIEKHFNDLILVYTNPVILKQQASSIFYTLFSSLENTQLNDTSYTQLKASFLKKINEAPFLEDFSIILLETITDIKNHTMKAEHDPDNALLNNIKYYIHNHFASDITLASVAENFHFSYAYLSSFFTTHFHTNFSDYLKTIRLNHAKELLKNPELNLSEISAACGYSELSYFSRTFKKEFGLTPSKYRREVL